jgi:hypothetical protein
MAAPVITPGGPLADHGKDVENFSADQNVTWTKSGGTFAHSTVNSVDWTAPNVTGTYTVTGTNGTAESDTVTITVQAEIFAVPSRDYEPVNDRKMLVFEPDSGPPQTRSKGDKSQFPFVKNNATRAEGLEMKALWEAHYDVGKRVYFTDPYEGVQSSYLFWSEFKLKWHAANLCSYSFVLKKVS